MFALSKEGYVLNYLTTEAVISDFVAPYQDKNQLKFEGDMRTLYNKPCTETPQKARLGEVGALGKEWKFYAKNRNPYVDFSVFYFTLTDVKIHAFTQLVSEKAKKVRARVWSYARVNLWVNNVHSACIAEPVYKPISHTDFVMDLKEGRNDIFVSMENFGVRDTRNLFMLQLMDTEGISVTLPADEEDLIRLKEAEDWLCSIVSDGNVIRAQSKPPVEVNIRKGSQAQWEKWGNEAETSANGGRNITIEFEVCGQKFRRVLDLLQNYNLIFDTEESTVDERIHEAMQFVGDTESVSHLSGLHVIAHFTENGKLDERDLKRLDHVLEKVSRRIDCADFGLLTLLLIYRYLPISEEYKQKIKKVALDFRYWMDEEGADGMCFWSENHALMFYGCQMAAGSIWPEEFFHRSNRVGTEQFKVGYRRVCEWFDLVEHEGFEEFLAGGYLLVTVTALLFVHMFGDAGLKERAKKVTDRIVYEACLQCFDGIHMAPMGRIYRGSLTPYDSCLQALLYLVDGKNRKLYNEWSALLSVADYRFPEDAADLIYRDTEITFNTGRASVTTKKTKDYMLTSVASPRKIPLPEYTKKDTEYYQTFLMNEWFHGTSLFIPGEYGYQQHLWYAGLSKQCYIFVNHPGSEKDFGANRPDYWFGNGVFPALMQDGNTLYCYYEIPDEHPTKFTHLYWPSFAMDEEKILGNYKFARVGTGYLGVWCSQKMELNNTDSVMDADYRAYGERTAWVVRVGSETKDQSFEHFIEEFTALPLEQEEVKKLVW